MNLHRFCFSFEERALKTNQNYSNDFLSIKGTLLFNPGQKNKKKFQILNAQNNHLHCYHRTTLCQGPLAALQTLRPEASFVRLLN